MMYGNEDYVSSGPDEEKIRTVPSLDKGSTNTRHSAKDSGAQTDHTAGPGLPNDSTSAVSSPVRHKMDLQ